MLAGSQVFSEVGSEEQEWADLYESQRTAVLGASPHGAVGGPAVVQVAVVVLTAFLQPFLRALGPRGRSPPPRS